MTRASDTARLLGAGGSILGSLDVGGGQIGGRRNIIINGAMNVAQRSTSETGLGTNGSTYNTVDRFKNVLNGTAGRFTQTQTADGPNGFANCLKFDVTTADTSIAAGEYCILAHYLQGQDVQQIKKGTSDAEKVTVSFYVKGNASATYTLELEDADNNRRNSQTFAVTTSWNRVVLTFNADTTGTLDDDNARSFNVNFWLHAGADFTGGTFSNNSWGTDANTRASSSQTSIFDSTDRTFFITGIQLEIGSVATPFEHMSFGEELALCERYFQILLKHGDGSDGGVAALGATASMYSTSYMTVPIMLRTPMRSSPTLISANSTGCFRFYRSNGNDVFDDFTAGSARNKYALEMYNTSDMSGTQGDSGFIQTVNSNAILSVDAEL